MMWVLSMVGLDAGAVEGGGDDGDMNSCPEGKELGDVCSGNEVAWGHQREEEYMERTRFTTHKEEPVGRENGVRDGYKRWCWHCLLY